MYCVIKITPAFNRYEIAVCGLYHYEAKMIATSRNQSTSNYMATFQPDWYPVNGCYKLYPSYYIACHKNNIEWAVNNFMESNDFPKVKRYYINK